MRAAPSVQQESGLAVQRLPPNAAEQGAHGAGDRLRPPALARRRRNPQPQPSAPQDEEHQARPLSPAFQRENAVLAGRLAADGQARVELRPPAANPPGLEQQRIRRGVHRAGQQAHGVGPQPAVLLVPRRPDEVGRQPRPEALGLADVERAAAPIQEEVNPGRLGRVRQFLGPEIFAGEIGALQPLLQKPLQIRKVLDSFEGQFPGQAFENRGRDGRVGLRTLRFHVRRPGGFGERDRTGETLVAAQPAAHQRQVHDRTRQRLTESRFRAANLAPATARHCEARRRAAVPRGNDGDDDGPGRRKDSQRRVVESRLGRRGRIAHDPAGRESDEAGVAFQHGPEQLLRLGLVQGGDSQVLPRKLASGAGSGAATQIPQDSVNKSWRRRLHQSTFGLPVTLPAAGAQPTERSMQAQIEHGHRRTLVVGAGMTGATLAYLSARAGAPTALVSVDRPCSQATALASGVVHGLGPPGERRSWTHLSAEAHQVSARRARRGCEVLQDVLLAAPRSVGYVRLPHELHSSFAGDALWIENVGQALAANGWPTRLEERPGGPVLVRAEDATVDPRRLTFELLRQAKALGATVRLGVACRGIQGESPEGLLVRLGDEVACFSRILWAGGRPGPDGAPHTPVRTRLVLRQLLGPGEAALPAILELGDMDLVLSPDPLREGCAVLVRVADENPAGGLAWPEAPPEWGSYRGQALRQRLAEAAVCVAERGYHRAGSIVCFGGLMGWPLTSVLGACMEAVQGSLDPTLQVV